MKKKGFFWDLNWNLETGSEIALLRAMNETLAAYGYSERATQEEINSWYGVTWTEMFRRTLGTNFNEEEFKKLRIEAEALCNEVYTPKYMKRIPYSKRILTAIKEKGYPNIIISNASQAGVDKMLNQLELDDLVDIQIGLDGNPKKTTKAELIQYYMTELNLSHVVMSGDSIGDVKTGWVCGSENKPRCEPAKTQSCITTYLFIPETRKVNGNIPEKYLSIPSTHLTTGDHRQLLKNELGIDLYT